MNDMDIREHVINHVEDTFNPNGNGTQYMTQTLPTIQEDQEDSDTELNDWDLFEELVQSDCPASSSKTSRRQHSFYFLVNWQVLEYRWVYLYESKWFWKDHCGRGLACPVPGGVGLSQSKKRRCSRINTVLDLLPRFSGVRIIETVSNFYMREVATNNFAYINPSEFKDFFLYFWIFFLKLLDYCPHPCLVLDCTRSPGPSANTSI